MAEKWKDRLTDQLCEAILSLETVDDVYRFLEDIATIGRSGLSRRDSGVQTLKRGVLHTPDRPADRSQYSDDQQGKEILEYGADGCKLVLERLRKAALARPTHYGALLSEGAVFSEQPAH